jgi:hypothetical protein
MNENQPREHVSRTIGVSEHHSETKDGVTTSHGVSVSRAVSPTADPKSIEEQMVQMRQELEALKAGEAIVRMPPENGGEPSS